MWIGRATSLRASRSNSGVDPQHPVELGRLRLRGGCQLCPHPLRDPEPRQHLVRGLGPSRRAGGLPGLSRSRRAGRGDAVCGAPPWRGRSRVGQSGSVHRAHDVRARGSAGHPPLRRTGGDGRTRGPRADRAAGRGAHRAAVGGPQHRRLAAVRCVRGDRHRDAAVRLRERGGDRRAGPPGPADRRGAEGRLWSRGPRHYPARDRGP